ncbi:hypothetical protein ACFY3G_19025 [Streptomyces phaeochromogenes]|uniref:hypothetical protein n=1 Tax=Streptomyces phaeochromogenes TaxID=1923 RepID=UPI0036B7B7ED
MSSGIEDHESSCGEQEKADYAAALAEIFDAARARAARQKDLVKQVQGASANRPNGFSGKDVSLFLNGKDIAPREFVDLLVDLALRKGVPHVEERREDLHALRRAAEMASTSPSIRLRSVEEENERLKREIDLLQKRLEEAEHARYGYGGGGPQPDFHQLQAQLDNANLHVDQIQGALHTTRSHAEANRQRLAVTVGRAVMAAIVSHTETSAPFVAQTSQQQESLDEARQMLADIQQRLNEFLPPDQRRAPGDAAGTDVTNPSGAALARPQGGAFASAPRPVKIYVWTVAGIITGVLCLNAAAFVSTCRADTGLTLGQLLAYVVLVLPLALGGCWLLTLSAMAVAGDPATETRRAAGTVIALCAVTAVAAGLLGSIYLPPIAWAGRAWANWLGLL